MHRFSRMIWVLGVMLLVPALGLLAAESEKGKSSEKSHHHDGHAGKGHHGDFMAKLNLTDEQKARFTALGEDQRRQIAARKRDRPLAQPCDVAQPAAMQWPTAEIDARLRPTDAQRTSLVALQDASAKAAEMLKTSCQADDAVTPPARRSNAAWWPRFTSAPTSPCTKTPSLWTCSPPVRVSPAPAR